MPGRKGGKIGKYVQRSAKLRTMLRMLRRRHDLLADEREPQPECHRAVVGSGGKVYCTDEVVTERVGGSAVACYGTRCGRAELPPKEDDDG